MSNPRLKIFVVEKRLNSSLKEKLMNYFFQLTGDDYLFKTPVKNITFHLHYDDQKKKGNLEEIAKYIRAIKGGSIDVSMQIPTKLTREKNILSIQRSLTVGERLDFYEGWGKLGGFASIDCSQIKT